MNHCVPDFDIVIDEDEYPILTASGLTRPKKPALSMPEDDIMELLWQNGQVVMQSQNQRSLKKSPAARYATDGVIPAGPSTPREIRPSPQQEVENYHNQNMFMQEDEMESWLHNPIVDDSPLDQNFCAELLYPPPTFNNNNSTMQNPVRASQVSELRQPSGLVMAPPPPMPPARTTEQAQTRLQNFAHFSKHNARVDAGPSSSKNVMRESTVVDSSETPAVAPAVSRISDTVGSLADPTYVDTGLGSMSTGGVAAPSTTSAGGVTGERDAMTCEMTVTSSPGGSSGSDEPPRREVAGNRKRKGREPEESECQSEDMEFECGEAKKQVRGSTSTKRSRAAEVHNLSERRRRDRINEKMRALQELIPRCNKSDKASMLDEAIEYLKSLQLQVQMMSVGCGMVPMMFPGIQQYMASSMGMGLGMGMGMNRPPPVIPFSNMLAAPPLPASAAATAHLGPRFPIPPFHMPPHVAPPADSSRVVQAAAAEAASSQSDPLLNSLRAPDPYQYSRIPNFTDPFQQYLSPHQMPFQYFQNQAINQPNVGKPGSSSRGHENPENHHAEGS